MSDSTTTRTPLADVEIGSRVFLTIEKACALIERLQAEKAELLAALKLIVELDDQCGCQHDNGNCCAGQPDAYCALCIAAVAIAKVERA